MTLAASALKVDLHIDGQWRASRDGAVFTVENPATGEGIAQVADSTPVDAIAALDAAVRAAEDWAATAPRVRSDILMRVFTLVTERAESIAELITLEMGKPLDESRAEVRYGAEFLRWFAEEAVRVGGRTAATPDASGTMIVTKQPVGPCYLITPWNFPLAMATRKIGPAFAAGCTVLIKPAALTPLTTLYLAGLFEEAGLPRGVLNVIPTTHSAAVSDVLMSDSRLRKVSFTGSTEVGQVLLRQAAGNVLRTSMELGGNAPFIVFDDADLDAAVEGALIAKFRNVGQACTAANRFLVQEGIHDAFVSRLVARVQDLRVGDGRDANTDIGPLINENAVARIRELVDDATERGARKYVGGEAPSAAFFPPTVLTHVPADAHIHTQEIFGPVISVATFETEPQAIALANGTEYGLAAYVFTSDLARGHRMMAAVNAGMLGINAGAISNPAAPFGGTKHSGLGREGGSEGIHEYLDTKYAYVPNVG